MRHLTIALIPLLLSGCLGLGKTRLVPQAYMPDPPAILMKAPKELHTIKNQKSNLTVTETNVIVEEPKKE